MSIGELMSAQRHRRGWSQDRLAELLRETSGRATVTRDEIARWERGRRRPSRYWLAWIATVLDVDLARLEQVTYGTTTPEVPARAEDAVRVAHEWLVTDPPQRTHLDAGRRVGSSLAETTEARVHELRLLDDHLAGGDTAELVSRELEHTRHLVDTASYSDSTGRRLYAVLAELGQLAGWVASDAGQHAAAQRYYLDAVRAGHAAGDDLAAANALSSLSYQVATSARPDEAVLLARTAVAGAPTATGRTRALLLERLAWAHARSGESAATERALDDVDTAHAEASEDEPIWVYWLDRREVDIMAGRCYVELHRPLRAVPLLSTAIAGYDRTYEREVGLYETWLAEAYQQANEHDAARAALARAAELADGVASDRLTTRLAALTD